MVGLKSVEKEYNDLPPFAKTLLEDPKLTQEDHEKIQDDLTSYSSRFEALRKLVLVKEER